MTTTTRFAALDVLRGIAILGTLATNVWIFTHPEGLAGYINGSLPITGEWDLPARILQQLSQGKFLGLLTIMFGIGLALQQQSARKAGQSWPGHYPLRAGLLFIDGLLHFLLVAEFDVLMGYAVTALLVSYLLLTRPRSQWVFIFVATGIHLAMLGLIVLVLAFAGPQSVPPLEPNPYIDGSWWDLVLFRIDNLLLFRLEPVFIFMLSIALFLVGARLLEAGVLEASGARLRARLMWVGLAVALPVDMALGVFGGIAGIMAARYGTAPLVALGLLALVAESYHRRPSSGFLGRRLSEVGRMALSCYVLQNLLASILCYGWGLGWAGRVEPELRVPLTLVVYMMVAMGVILFAHYWLRAFSRGPLEWLWNMSYSWLTGNLRPG
ncbi:MAG: DUF418 domain-containing protein [Burkholderiales bacterium]|nr:MAG: DUF418 domain-containing protein [Burkholderiales bacterium]